VSGWGDTENTLPSAEELFGPERGDPGEIREQVLRDLGHRTSTRARQPQIEGDPDSVAELRQELGL
jgi:hypothetical protein